jgi:formyl-CoA transferase
MWSLSPDVMAGPFVGGMPTPDRRRAPNPITNSYPTSDGRWLYLVCLQSDRYWQELCAVIDRSDLAGDERFGDMVARAQNCEACVAELEKTFLAETLAVWQERLRSFTGVWAPCLTPAEVHEHVAVQANGYLPELLTNDGTAYRLPSPPAQFGGVPSRPRGPAPEVGQHTEEILLELGHDWDHIGELRTAGALG